ncbi:2-dehydropantoate 2-reductase [Mesorhizobium sp. BAC0120]|uniref:2-dehydropantoate 2-reductase n=1 Tax=Mesorhizobium sp. BAC0120 TaxID=3090670 RepID=UPI00298CD30A|nr:2-dehydropantoate 2-reductase [Mesorhizobium sp. BAC0120]MDW6025357.1 2-dehydropantoate 2-reductase [Mesorhizobium sp. BAC0120]
MLDRTTRIAVAGAGSIGCHAGGCLALAGRRVTLLARQPLAEAIGRDGLTIVDLDGSERKLAPSAIDAAVDPAVAFNDAGLVLVTVKSGDTAEMAGLIARHARPDATVVSLQNGAANAARLRQHLPATQRVVAGMVSFNVIQDRSADGAPVFRRTTGGEVLVEAGVPGLVELLNVDGLPVESAADMTAVLWGKLILNLTNAINALSGLPLVEYLSDRRWRLVLAAQIEEALAAMRAAGINPAKVGALRPAFLPYLLRLPDFLFRIIARRMLTVDPKAKPSTLQDLERGRKTETDEFQGAIVRLSEQVGTAAPLSRLVLRRIRAAEQAGKGSPRLAPDDFKLPAS